MKKILTLIMISIAVVILSGCSFVRIQNVSDASITVSVNVPDSGSSYTRTIRSGNIVDVFSATGGRYTVSMIPSERYRETLATLQQQISTRLFEERQTLTADQVAQLVQNLNSIDKLIEDLANPMPSCSGRLPEFDTVVVVVSYDNSSGNYALSCGSGSG
jgi:outer membrane lipopolysaccharide assembly protein LptE/RlpB